MKHLQVAFLAIPDNCSPEQISAMLDTVDRNHIQAVPWPAFGYKPAVSFAIGYSDRSLLIKYYVREKHARALYTRPNDPVYKDSCVEFFISFREQEEYYNFEFNCAGTCLLGFGPEKNDRKGAPENIIEMIQHHATLKPSNSIHTNIAWELTLIIPLKAFWFHQLTTLKGENCRVNFFKCGDDLPEPHFLSWNKIETDKPDFHIREFFGTLQFTG